MKSVGMAEKWRTHTHTFPKKANDIELLLSSERESQAKKYFMNNYHSNGTSERIASHNNAQYHCMLWLINYTDLSIKYDEVHIRNGRQAHSNEYYYFSHFQGPHLKIGCIISLYKCLAFVVSMLMLNKKRKKKKK